MSFNPEKTEILFFSNTGNIDNIKFSFNGKSIPLYNLLNDISFSPISFMYIRNMRGPNTDPWGTPAETSIPLSTSHKHLGVILSQNAKWNEHLENMITNITKHLGILRKLKFSLNRSNFKPVTILAASN
jgi:hypothetical protein